MRKKNNSIPISLFSFQDIITCLTGIMIVIVLVILLQLVDSVAQAAARVEHHPEFQVMRNKLAELMQKEELLKKELASLKNKKEEKDRRFQHATEAEIRFMIKQEEAKAIPIREKLDDLNRDLNRLRKEISQAQARDAILKQQIREQIQMTDHIKKLAMQAATLRKQKRELGDAIQRKSKMLEFEFSGFYDHTPVLIEVCTGGFRAKVYPDGEIVSFGDPKAYSSPLGSLSSLKNWLSRQSGKVYPVFLFKSNTLRFHDDVVFSFTGQNIGRELLDDGEECF